MTDGSETSSSASGPEPAWLEVEHRLSESGSSSVSEGEESAIRFTPTIKVVVWLMRLPNSYEQDVNGDIRDPNVLTNKSPPISSKSSIVATKSELDSIYLELACGLCLPGNDADGVKSTVSSSDEEEELNEEPKRNDD